MNRTTSGLSSFRKYVGYSFRLVIFFSANSIRATFGSIVRVSTSVPSFRKVVYPKCVETHRRDTNATRVQEPRVFQEKIKVVSKNGTRHPDFAEFHFGSKIPTKGFNIITRVIVKNETMDVEYLILYFFFFILSKIPLEDISFKNSFSNNLQRVRKSRFFWRYSFWFLKFLKPFNFHIFPINHFLPR